MKISNLFFLLRHLDVWTPALRNNPSATNPPWNTITRLLSCRSSLINYQKNKQHLSPLKPGWLHDVTARFIFSEVRLQSNPKTADPRKNHLSLSLPSLFLFLFNESFRKTQTISSRQNSGQASVMSSLTLLLFSPKLSGRRTGTQNQHAHNGALLGPP